MKTDIKYLKWFLLVYLILCIFQAVGQDTTYHNTHYGGFPTDTVFLDKPDTAIFHKERIESSFCKCRFDTIPVTISAEDTTFRPSIWYYVVDAYGDPIDSSKTSNCYRTSFPGWDVNGHLVGWRFEEIDPKYKILTTWIREWETIEESVKEEIRQDGQNFIIYNGRKIYFQQKGHFK